MTIVCLFALSAHAGQPEARETARINNCNPKKIEIYQQSLGSESQTIYRVQCTMPKTVDAADAATPDALLISCDQNLCQMLRAVVEDKK